MVFKCKMCGGDIEVIKGTNTGKCIYCKSVMTLPNLDNEKIINLYNRANDLRLNSEFDKAQKVYESVLEIDNKQTEAHWGLLLCKYGVEYVDDPKTKKKIPTCHRTSDYSILLDSDYKVIKKEAHGGTLRIYEKEAKQIDDIQKSILFISKKEKPYDVFICYKETNDKGERTHDSVIAQDIYDKLVEKGLKVFFSRITLEDKLGQEYEPYIYSALKSSKVMLVVGTKEEYFNAVWVKNEWSRYLQMMKMDKGKALIPVYSNIDAYKLPEEFAMLQSQSMDKVGAIQDLVRGVKKIVSEYKVEDIEGVDKETVAKVQAVLDDARNLGNGQYEVTILKENLPIWWYVFITGILGLTSLIYLILLVDSIYFTNIYYISDGYTSILESVSYSRLPLLFFILAYITIILALLLSYKRKTYKCKKIFSLISLTSLLLLYINLLGLGIIPNVFTDNKFDLAILLIFNMVPFIISLLIFFINPSWTINSSVKSIMSAEEKDKQLKKNKYIKGRFKIKEKTKIKFPVYIVLIIIILISIYHSYSFFKKPQENGRIESNEQFIVTNEFIRIRKEPDTYENIIGNIKKGEIYTIYDKYENDDCSAEGAQNYCERWYKIRTNKGLEGWIAGTINGNQYIKQY